MNVIVICEYSGRVRDAFLRRGHNAISCDLLPTDVPGPHIQGDCQELDYSKYDMVIGHPPCTYLCNSGVRWLHSDANRWIHTKTAAAFFKWMMELPVPKIAVENPVMHRYAIEIIGRKQDQIIQPWWFGEDASKATGLWLKGLPKLVATNPLKKQRYANQTPTGQNNLGPSEHRWKLRSMTYHKVAEAMAEQWTK
jgi:hypothetical protein